MSDHLEVLAPGTKVFVSAHQKGRDGGIEALITAVQVREDSVRYLASWYSGGQRHEEYVTKDEIVLSGLAKPVRIGFQCPEELQAPGGALTSHKREVRR